MVLPCRIACDLCGQSFGDEVTEDDVHAVTFGDARRVCEDVGIVIFCSECFATVPVVSGGEA